MEVEDVAGADSRIERKDSKSFYLRGRAKDGNKSCSGIIGERVGVQVCISNDLVCEEKYDGGHCLHVHISKNI